LEQQTPELRLRKADFWTALVILAIGIFMMIEALGYPLEGSYAGVRNVWYVSPALFPLMVAGMLILLSAYLLLNAIRAGGARAAIIELAEGAWGTAFRSAIDVWIVCLMLAAYIVILVPRIDFTIATIPTLFTFLAVYYVERPSVARRGLVIFLSIAVLLLGVTAVGFQPASRSAGFYWRDAAIFVAALAQIAVVASTVWRDDEAWPRLRRSIVVAFVTPLLLSVIFKYGLIVPLPAEGLAVEIMERIRYFRF
jgi:hypothetical protein